MRAVFGSGIMVEGIKLQASKKSLTVEMMINNLQVKDKSK